VILRSAVPEEIDDDLTPQAGWMYADLFLALMVIFLATISFVPQLSNNASKIRTATIQPKSAYNYDKGLSLVYEKFDLAQISEDIAKFEQDENLPAETDVIYAQIVGGYDSKIESPQKGTLRALAFSFLMNSSNTPLFMNAATNLGASDQIKPNQILLRLTFAAKLKV
jgi:hypothetical protein